MVLKILQTLVVCRSLSDMNDVKYFENGSKKWKTKMTTRKSSGTFTLFHMSVNWFVQIPHPSQLQKVVYEIVSYFIVSFDVKQ